LEKLANKIREGNRRALAQLLTRVENGNAHEELAQLFPHTGRAHIIGVTGAPGTGKSTLVNALARAIRASDRTAGIIAVDPTSPFTGGALLGDRVRMADLAGDAGIFIRSMASRGALGGLATTTGDMVRVMDAAGFDCVIVETVGVGQAEVEVARSVDTTIVINAPGLGDDIQANKAGIMEIADVLVVNKAELPGADRLAHMLRANLELGQNRRAVNRFNGMLYDETKRFEGWEVPIIPTTAVTGEGIDALLKTIDAHRAHLLASGEGTARQRARIAAEIEHRLKEALLQDWLSNWDLSAIRSTIDRVAQKKMNLYNVIINLLSDTQSI
jgi:LAO/AO transport system kinase